MPYWEGPVPAFVPVLPYLPMSVDHSDSMKYESRDSRRYGREHSYSGGYGGPSDLQTSELYGSYGGLHSGGSGTAYGGYGGYSSRRTGSSGIPTIGGRPPDLHGLFVEVTSRGRMDKESYHWRKTTGFARPLCGGYISRLHGQGMITYVPWLLFCA